MAHYVITYGKIWINSQGIIESETYACDMACACTDAAQILADYQRADTMVTDMPLQETLSVKPR